MEAVFGDHAFSRCLPQVVGKDRHSRPDSGPGRASGQHSSQTKLAFEHTDRRFDAAAKPLQLPEPRFSLVHSFTTAQPTHFRDTDFFNPGPAKLHDVIGTIIASIGGKLLGLYAKSGF